MAVRPILLILLPCILALGAATADAQDGAALYKEHCATCHGGATDRAPSLDVLRTMTPQRILEALEFGSMVSMTHGRTTAERRALAEHVSGKALGAAFSIAPPSFAMCGASAPSASSISTAARWSGFGQNPSNTRFQPGATAGIAAADVPRLKLK